MRVVFSLVVLGWLSAWGLSAHAQIPAAQEFTSATRGSQLAAWLADLDHEEFARREAAAQQLRAAGPPAIEILAAGATGESPEVAWRSGEILKQIALDGDDATLDRVAAALSAVGHADRPGMHGLVAEIRTRLVEVRRERAVAVIRKLGGQISGGSAEGAFGVDVGFILAEPAFAAPMVIAEDAFAIEVAEVEAVPDAADADPAEAPQGEVPAIDLDAVVAKALRAVPKIEVAEERVIEGGVVIEEPVLLEADAMAFFGPAIAFDAFPGAEAAEPGASMGLSLDANWRGGDAGLAAVADLPEITVVSISQATIGDKGLEQLAKLPRLRSLTITQTEFSADVLRALHRAKPAMSLFCQGSAMLGIHADRGGDCTLTSVYPGSGAAEAGLQTGDKIITIDGVEIRDFAELTISVYTRKAGDKLVIAYERDGKQHTATVELKPRAVLEP
jgi:membrane-associated protease RseP (regulator of RpoE activity)